MNGRDYLLTLRPAIAEGYCGGADPLSILDGAESAGAGNSAASRWTTRYLNPGESLPKGYKWIEDPVNPGKIIVFQDNDQQSQWFDDAFWQNYYIGVNGGGENIRYAASAGYTDDGGIGMATGFSRFTFHGNTSFKVTRRLTVTTTFDYSQIERQMLDGGALNKRNSVIRGLSVPATHRDWYDAEAGEDLAGTPAMGPNTTLPAAYYNYYYSDTGETTKRSSVNINLEWVIVDGLRAVAQFSNHNRHSRSHFFVKNNPTTGTNIRPTKEAFTETNRMDFQTYLNWKKTFAEDHNIDVVAGYDYMKDKNNSIDARVQGAASDKIPTLNVGTSNITNYPTSTRTDEVLISYFGRVNYNFREKYLLSFTMRADGSSKFAAGNRWGYFPAASAGWIVDEEAFWPQNKVVSSLKLRASYGLTGNNGIGLYDTYGSYNSAYQYNGMSTTTTGEMPNSNLTWESTTQVNAGLDMGLADDRVRVSFDYYDKVTRNLLFDVTLPNTTGYGSVVSNVGKVRFYGVDLAISSVNISRGDFTWTTDFTYNFNMNKVLKLPDNGNVRNRMDGITIGDGSQFGGHRRGRAHGPHLRLQGRSHHRDAGRRRCGDVRRFVARIPPLGPQADRRTQGHRRLRMGQPRGIDAARRPGHHQRGGPVPARLRHAPLDRRHRQYLPVPELVAEYLYGLCAGPLDPERDADALLHGDDGQLQLELGERREAVLVAAGRQDQVRPFHGQRPRLGQPQLLAHVGRLRRERRLPLHPRHLAFVQASRALDEPAGHERRDPDRFGQHALLLDGRARRIARSGDHRGTLQFGFDLCHGFQPLSARAQDPVQRQIHVLTP